MSQEPPLPQTSPRAPPGSTMSWMEALRTFPTQSMMTLPKSWASSLKRPRLLGAPSGAHLTWSRPSAAGFSLKMMHPGPAHHHLLKKQGGQVGQVRGWGGLGRRSVLPRDAFPREVCRAARILLGLLQGPEPGCLGDSRRRSPHA